MTTDRPLKGTVLVVDDDPDIRRMVALVLRREGYEVQTADSPMGVTTLVRRIEPKVLILDVSMPGLSGDNLAKLLTRAVGRRPIVFYSAMPDAELLALCRRIPDSTYLAKGAPLSRLVETVDRMVRLYASQHPH